MSFKEGDLVVDSRGRIGIVVSSFSSIAGNFYNVLIDGRLESLPEEELTKKGQ